MKKYLFLVFTSLLISSCDFSGYILEEEVPDFTTVFEKSGGTETATYPEVVSYYKELAAAYPSISIEEMGLTDSGEPLHLAIFSPNEDFDLEGLREDHSILFVLNGIHPGESDGIDATMMLFRDMAQDSIPVPENTIIATIPVYNIGGALNRNSTTRVNQQGPESYGFRGNARNFDLNRDFTKADTKNTRSFYEIFHYLNPDVFIDNHVSNGADYQYTLTHLFTQHNKLGGELGEYLQDEMMPKLVEDLQENDWDITPYVNVFDEVPEKGFSQFMDYPRYSTGYTALWNTLGMMVETHMLKPYDERVWGTYQLMQSMISITDRDTEKIKSLRESSFQEILQEDTFVFDFVADTTQPSTLQFKGYEGEQIESSVSGLPRLYYDQSKPFTKEIEYFNNFKPTREVDIPEGYIVPQGWWQVLNLLEMNQVEMQTFENDTTMLVETYHIEDFETRENAYEGHYLHYNTQVSAGKDSVAIRKGDFYVSVDQRAKRYLLAVLEPEATDSFFNWNFFDSVLQQKEGFSPYVFEDLAEEILTENPEIEDEFEERRENEPEFAANGYAQLDWILKQSKYYEKSHLRYPIFRLP